MGSFDFSQAHSVEEACQLLARTGGRVIAGGTDIVPQLRDGRFRADTLVDLSRIDDLRYIRRDGEEISIGALSTYTEMHESPLLQSSAALLAETSGMVGGIQTQNRGTLGGNIANASPAGDMLPPLLALNAVVDLVSSSGSRSLPLEEFLIGPGKTTLAPGEIICQVRFAPLPSGTRSLFTRLGNRQGMVISVVSAAVVLQVDSDNTVSDVRIALGAVAPTAIRCTAAEELLRGQIMDAGRLEAAAEVAVQASRPIDDVRASARYRRHVVRILVRRALQELYSGSKK